MFGCGWVLFDHFQVLVGPVWGGWGLFDHVQALIVLFGCVWVLFDHCQVLMVGSSQVLIECGHVFV